MMVHKKYMANAYRSGMIEFEGWRHSEGYEVIEGKLRPKVTLEPVRKDWAPHGPGRALRKNMKLLLLDKDSPPSSPAELAIALRDKVVASTSLKLPTIVKYQPPANFYLIFANLASDDQSIVSFADQFGLLNSATYEKFEETFDLADIVDCEEPIEDWRVRIAQMKQSLEQFSSGPDPAKGGHLRESLLARRGDRDALYCTNGYLEMAKLQLRIEPDGDGGRRFEERIRPINLLASLWTELAQALTGGRSFEKCRYCKELFVFNPAPGRIDRFNRRRNCGPSCRVMSHHRDRSFARQLYDKGLPVREVITRLKENGWEPSPTSPLSAVEQVKKWLQS